MNIIPGRTVVLIEDSGCICHFLVRDHVRGVVEVVHGWDGSGREIMAAYPDRRVIDSYAISPQNAGRSHSRGLSHPLASQTHRKWAGNGTSGHSGRRAA